MADVELKLEPSRGEDGRFTQSWADFYRETGVYMDPIDGHGSLKKWRLRSRHIQAIRDANARTIAAARGKSQRERAALRGDAPATEPPKPTRTAARRKR